MPAGSSEGFRPRHSHCTIHTVRIYSAASSYGIRHFCLLPFILLSLPMIYIFSHIFQLYICSQSLCSSTSLSAKVDILLFFSVIILTHLCQVHLCRQDQARAFALAAPIAPYTPSGIHSAASSYGIRHFCLLPFIPLSLPMNRMSGFPTASLCIGYQLFFRLSPPFHL